MIKLDALVKAIHNSVMKSNEVLQRQNDALIKTYFKKDEAGDFYEAKTVALQFPQTTQSGEIEMLDVEIPLITLIPMASPQIEEMKFETDLNLQLIGEKNEVHISFSQTPSSSNNDTSPDNLPKSSLAHLEITIKPGETTEGLKKLIEGYERLLRAQIPG